MRGAPSAPARPLLKVWLLIAPGLGLNFGKTKSDGGIARHVAVRGTTPAALPKRGLGTPGVRGGELTRTPPAARAAAPHSRWRPPRAPPAALNFSGLPGS